MNDRVTFRRLPGAPEVLPISVRLLAEDERWREVFGQRCSRRDRVPNRKTVRVGDTCK